LRGQGAKGLRGQGAKGLRGQGAKGLRGKGTGYKENWDEGILIISILFAKLLKITTMKKLILLVLLVITATCASEKEKKWKLVWSDEFNYTGLPDSTKWDYEEGFIRNNEAQYYTRNRPENARVENGTLVIEARRDFFHDSAFSSASLNTFNKREFLYGRIEMNAKLPYGNGVWPAFWTLGTNINDIGWPACGEIDIMEYVGFDTLTIHANIHTKAYNHVVGTNKGNRILIAKPWDEFHLYAMEWFKDRIDFYVDTTKYFTFQNEGTGNDAWPFDKPQYILVNLAIGGSWGGQHGIDTTIFPQQYVIDWVRVYE
jgi:beta-glucanase (GH16 family)